MDAQTLRRALADFFSFNPKDFNVQGTPTGYSVSVNRNQSSDIAIADYSSFQVRNKGIHFTGTVADGAAFEVREGNLNEAVPNVEGNTVSPDVGWWKFIIGASQDLTLILEAGLNNVGVVSRRLFLTNAPGSYVTQPGNPDTGDPPPFAWRHMARLVTNEKYKLTIIQYKKGDQTVSLIVSDFSCTTKVRNVVWEKSD